VDAPQNESDIYGLRYAEFVVPLVKAVQELNDEIKQKDKRIEELETSLEKAAVLEAQLKQIEELEARLNVVVASKSISYEEK
jgi:hypothetical protein